MRLGIFAKTFVRPTLAETLDAVTSHGLDCIQFNFACAGLPSMPDKIPPEVAAQIGNEVKQRKLTMAAVSGTFNMIDPDVSKRQAGLRRLEEMAASCAALGTSLITLCTGSRDPENLWRQHPENDSPEAWSDLRESMTRALEIARRHNVFLGVEPETANVISSAKKARRLLDEIKSRRLKIVIDPVNMFAPGDDKRGKWRILNEAFDLLRRDIALAHAKDFRDGIVWWEHYISHLRMSGFCGPLIMHGMAESEVDDSAVLLRKKMLNAGRCEDMPNSDWFAHDGIKFLWQYSGEGIPFFYQHGLGGDVDQPFGIFQPPRGIGLLAFDCRGHGQTYPVGPEEKIGIATFADDLRALMDHLNIKRAILGGISMGAAIALNFALRHPERVLALVLQRPAWLDAPRKENVEIYSYMAKLIREHGPEKGLEIFKMSPAFQRAWEHSPAGAKSLIGSFLNPRAAQTVALLERIPTDSPHPDRAAWRGIKVPTLVLANKKDEVHPFEYGLELAREIPGAEFRELTPKSVNLEAHNAEVQRFIDAFLLQHF